MQKAQTLEVRGHVLMTSQRVLLSRLYGLLRRPPDWNHIKVEFFSTSLCGYGQGYVDYSEALQIGTKEN